MDRSRSRISHFAIIGPVTQSVLLPDMTYNGASYAHGKLQIQYQMPVTIKKHTNVWFVKATGAYLKTDKKTDSKMFGISLGLYH